MAPFMLGFSAARLLTPGLSLNVDLFVAATLGATSIGISARVPKDLHQSQTREAHVILGAAVIDDVLGLVMLAISMQLTAAKSAVLMGRLTTDLAKSPPKSRHTEDLQLRQNAAARISTSKCFRRQNKRRIMLPAWLELARVMHRHI